MRILCAGAACVVALLVSLAASASAQSYPTRSITMIVPFAPGGPADVLGRLIGQKTVSYTHLTLPTILRV